ncbi:uncharacterized protein LOC127769381 [Oryza glaberrima]|uniref:DUF4220 domain-containing protein n=1 Tax=Oryza glaberrima TaxID=4538 RepID=I1PIZ0_ORYGL|nr:uncharacterized protein LOC127769381 [Oryza glaberrima]XP_052150900.1 uncharacterized protein LOC127769381 [Oryza glaberrima]AHW98654.1 hypothetical protein [Oryza glaberrima]
MAGEGWAMDIIWHVLVLAWNTIGDVWNGWSMEILLGASFLMQLVLAFSAGFRWRGDSNKLRNVIWLFYVGGDYVATLALGHLSVSGTSGKRRLVAFWAPFFLLHLGGPDSITAYELEDNQLSARYVLELVLRVAGAVYIVYKSISGSWALVPAAWLMLLVGVAKYTEKTLALHGANLANVRRSVERQQHRHHIGGGSHHSPKLAFATDDNDDALVMKAHTLFNICKNSLVDSSVETESTSPSTDSAAAQTREALFDLRWKELFRVMEIELSLMYDFLYTKAAVIHTWHGYCIRALSPLAITVSLVLVELSNEGGRRHKRSDIVITRVLLVATFLLELASLLRALSSTWTGFLLHSKLRPGWIRHEVLCMRRWHRFHSAITSLGRPAKAQAHRQWLGKMGQLNMLQLVITQKELERPAPKGGQYWDKEYQRCSNETMIPEDVKKLVSELVSGQLRALRHLMKEVVAQEGADALSEGGNLLRMAVYLRKKRGQQALKKGKLFEELRWSLGDELQLGILTWHIATNMFLLLSGKAAKAKGECAGDEGPKVCAIMTLSNYMMYLLAVRPYMLPGLVTRKLIELTCEELAQIWSKHQAAPAAVDDLESSSSPSFCNVRVFMRSKFSQRHNRWRVSTRLSHGREEEELANMFKGRDNDAALNKYLSRGIDVAEKLLDLEDKRKGEEMDMVQVILEVWVEMLFYASYQCSKESHAKQLSQGGELTTIVWLMAEHAGLFLVNKTTKGVEEANWRTRKENKKKEAGTSDATVNKLS